MEIDFLLLTHQYYFNQHCFALSLFYELSGDSTILLLLMALDGVAVMDRRKIWEDI